MQRKGLFQLSNPLETHFLTSSSSKKIIAPLLKPYREELLSKGITLNESTVLSMISKAKSKGRSPEDFLTHSAHVPPSDIDLIVAYIYTEYDLKLRKSNSFDFDDLLLFGLKLFKDHEKSVRWCKHVLVDELYGCSSHCACSNVFSFFI